MGIWTDWNCLLSIIILDEYKKTQRSCDCIHLFDLSYSCEPRPNTLLNLVRLAHGTGKLPYTCTCIRQLYKSHFKRSAFINSGKPIWLKGLSTTLRVMGTSHTVGNDILDLFRFQSTTCRSTEPIQIESGMTFIRSKSCIKRTRLWQTNGGGTNSVSSLNIYTFVVSRTFMAGAASQAGDADPSRAPGLTYGLQGYMNIQRGALLLVPQWRCISSFVFFTSTR